MTQTEPIGPRLSDVDFFQKIDTTRPGLEAIPDAVARGDFKAARRLFAAEARNTLQPQRFLTIKRDLRGNHFMYDGETHEQAAERILTGELISCGTPYKFTGEVDWFSNPTFNKYMEWTWQLSRHHEWAVLAARYRATGDERFAQGFVRFFESWVHQAIVPEDAPGWDTLCWRTIEAGIRMGGPWQWALHSFYRSPAFSDDVLIDWYKSIWEHGWRLRSFHRTGNWLIMEMNGLAQISILYPQFKDAPAWQSYAFDRLISELDAQVYPDGFQVELSTGYHQVDIHNYQWLIDVCTAYDVPVPPAFRAAMERMHTVNVLMMMPDGRLPDVNDGGWQDVSHLMESAAKDYPQRSDFLWAHTKGKEGNPPAETSHAFPYAGYYIMRSGWQFDAVWALFDGGPFGYGHQHEDKLNILLHAYGRLLLTEGGNYAYDNSEMRRYVLSTRSHNTIRVDGYDQNRRLGYDRDTFDVTAPAGAAWRTTSTHDVADASFDEWYAPKASSPISHRRTVIFIKRPSAGLSPFVIVVDRITPIDGQAHHCQALWHLNADIVTLEGCSVHTSDPGWANLSIIPASAPGLAVSIIAGQEWPEWQGWMTIKNRDQGQYAPAPVAIYDIAVSKPIRLVTLLYPTPAGVACPIAAVAASSDIGDTAIHLALADGHALDLDESSLARARKGRWSTKGTKKANGTKGAGSAKGGKNG